MSEPWEMTSEEYVATATQLALLGGFVAGMDLDLARVLNFLNHVDTIGPIVDPTAYRAGMRNVQNVRDLAEALQPFQEVAKRLLPSPTTPSGGGGEQDAVR